MLIQLDKLATSGPYDVIYADPPWPYDDARCVGKQGVANQYETLSPEDLAALRIPAAKDCALFLWATWPRLPLALETMKSWGFEYKSIAFVWVKLNPKEKPEGSEALNGPMIVQGGKWFSTFYGLGRWTRGNTEMVLLGIKGKPHRVDPSVYQLLHEEEPIYEQRARHSAKPPVVRDKIVKLMGDCPRLEMFARGEIGGGWDHWGLEAT